MIKQIHSFLNRFTIFAPFLRFLAYLKSDYFATKFEDRLINHMPRGWQKMRIIDLGCGPCYKERDKRFQGVNITCVDIYKPYLQICENLGFQTLHADIRNIETYFKQNSVDIVWLLDVIEHLKKSDGLRLLAVVEKIANKQIIIFMPLGEVPQEETDGNRYQRHISSWTEEDLKERGYTCYVLKKYHRDIRHQSKELAKSVEPISADAVWGIKNIA